jgi:hypothetical protein
MNQTDLDRWIWIFPIPSLYINGFPTRSSPPSAVMHQSSGRPSRTGSSGPEEGFSVLSKHQDIQAVERHPGLFGRFDGRN